MEIKFLVLILGARTPAPIIEEPVIKIPHAAPTTERPIHKAIPSDAQVYGEVSSRKRPTLKASPEPVKSMSSDYISGGPSSEVRAGRLEFVQLPTTITAVVSPPTTAGPEE